MPGESGKGDVDGHRFDVDRHHFLRYHLLGVLCWLYPVGYPRINIILLIIITTCLHMLKSRRIFPRHEALCDPLGELTRPTAEGGAPLEARTVNRDRSANPHPWTGALLRFARVLPPAETD